MPKLTQLFWRDRFFNFVKLFYVFSLISPLETGGALLIPFTEKRFVLHISLVEIDTVVLEEKISFTQGCLVSNLVEIKVVLKKIKMRKSLQSDDNDKDEGQRTHFDPNRKADLSVRLR